MSLVIDWNSVLASCITGSIVAAVIGAVTGITNWLLNRTILRRLDEIEKFNRQKRKETEEE